MSKDTYRRRRVGTAVMLVLMLILTAAVSVRFYHAETPVLRTRLASVAGLRPGAEVLISGFAVGRVTSILPMDLSVRAFEITIRLDQNWQVPNDSTIALLQANPIDVMRLNIVPGLSPEAFKSGDRIPATPPPPSLLDSLGHLGPQITAAVEKLSAAADQTVTLTAALNRMIGTPATATATTTGQGAGAKVATLNTILAETQTALTTTTGAIAGLQDETAKTLQSARKNLEQLQTIGKRSDGLIAQLSSLTADNSPDLRRMSRDSEFILHGLAQTITPLLDNLQNLTANLNDLAQQMRDNPNAVIFGRPPHEEPGQRRSAP